MRQQLEPFIDAVTQLVFASDSPEKADAIFIPGSRRPGPLIRATQLYHDRFAPAIIPSGKYGINKECFAIEGFETEADWMSDFLIKEGVPADAILLERNATYTWENALFSRHLCDKADFTIRKGLLCCRPFHARRALLYYQTAFPDAEWIACPANEPGVNADDWYRTEEGRKRVLGEVRRLGDQINIQLEELIRHG
ncbi:MAG: YdcF family protein [Clostridia bacterium]|nr:YdcF family protein [Clostridia bacterium]